MEHRESFESIVFGINLDLDIEEKMLKQHLEAQRDFDAIDRARDGELVLPASADRVQKLSKRSSDDGLWVIERDQAGRPLRGYLKSEHVDFSTIGGVQK